MPAVTSDENALQGVSKKVYTWKIFVKQRANKIGENLQLPKQVYHPLVHPALKLLGILSFSE